MIPSLLALPIALLPFAALAGALGWMVSTSERPERPHRPDRPDRPEAA